MRWLAVLALIALLLAPTALMLWSASGQIRHFTAMARATMRALTLKRRWSRASAVVTGLDEAGTDAAGIPVSVGFDLPDGARASATFRLPVYGQEVKSRGSPGGWKWVPSHVPYKAGDRVDIIFDPADPRHVEQHRSVAGGSALLVFGALLLPMLLSGHFSTVWWFSGGSPLIPELGQSSL